MSLDSSPAEYQPCPLQYHDFKHLDHSEHCPTYTAALDHGVTVAQLDALEKELLLMKSSIENHIHALEGEISALGDWQVKRDYKKRKHSETLDTVPRVSKPSDPNPPKKQKVEAVTVPEALPLVGGARKIKQAKPESAAEEPHESAKTSHRPKGDAPDRFWQLVEPYCAPITDADIKLLQEGLRSSDEDKEYFLVPALGQHYARKWALEDLLDEQSEAARLLEGNCDVWGDDSAETLLRQAELEDLKGDKDSKGQYGPLTQRLIAAFIDDPASSGKTFSLPAKSPTPSSISSDKLEKRIKDELIALGLFDLSEAKSIGGGEEDEVLAELKKKQAELKAVMDYNRHQREVLCALARQEMHVQQKMKELQGVDEEVMDWLRKYRQKKKTMSRKEREGVWKLLEKRTALCDQLQTWPRLPPR